MVSLTEAAPAGRQFIEGYGPDGFRIAGQDMAGAVLVFRERVLDWPVRTVADLDAGAIAPLIEAPEAVEILLLGCGRSTELAPRAVRERLKAAGIVLEPMDTGAACRTFNVLMLEDRRVAAALIPLGGA